MLGLLGIHLIRVRDSHAVLDVFPEGEIDKEVRLFGRTYPGLSEPSRLIFRSRSSVIEQRSIWIILIRALRVTTFDATIQESVNRIIELGEGFSSARNDVLYHNIAWLYKEDHLSPGTPARINDDPFSLATADRFFEERDSSFAFAMLMLGVVRSLIESVESSSGTNIVPTSYGVCFKSFTGFGSTKLHSVFSSIYRQESYGAAL